MRRLPNPSELTTIRGLKAAMRRLNRGASFVQVEKPPTCDYSCIAAIDGGEPTRWSDKRKPCCAAQDYCRGARSGLPHCSKQDVCSISSSARPRSGLAESSRVRVATSSSFSAVAAPDQHDSSHSDETREDGKSEGGRIISVAGWRPALERDRAHGYEPCRTRQMHIR